MGLTANSGNLSIDGVSGQQTVACYQIASLPGTYPTKGQSDIIVHKNKKIYTVYIHTNYIQTVYVLYIYRYLSAYISDVRNCLHIIMIYIYICIYMKKFCMHTFPANVNNEYMCTRTSSTAQGGGGSFKNRKRIGEIDCCE